MTLAGVTWVAVAGVIAVAVTVLQQAIGAFDTRRGVPVAFAVSAGFVALLIGRVRSRSEFERRLKGALRCWPAPYLRNADPHRLGLLPPGNRDAAPPARESSAQRSSGTHTPDPLETALSESPFILVFASTRAGRSRALFEVAQRALPNAQVIVPKDADGLRELLALTSPLKLAGPQVILWLDGLERFLVVLHRESLDEVAWATVPLTVVATTRKTDFDAVLEANGEQALAAESFEARAECFELPAELESGLAHENEPLPRPVASTKPKAPHDLVRDLLVFFSVAPLVVVGLLAATGNFLKEHIPSIRAQLEQRSADLRSAGYDVRGPLDLRLRTAGPTYLFVLTPTSGNIRPSDELRIYHEADGRLESKLRYQPLVHLTGKSETIGMRFRELKVSDLDHDERRELVGSYDYAALSMVSVPLAIAWDEVAQEYEVNPLIARAPRVNPRIVRAAGKLLGDTASAYDDGVELIAGRHRDHAWGATSLALVSSSGGRDVLLAGFSAAKASVRPQPVEVDAWLVQFEGAKSDVAQLCLGGNRRSVVRQPQPGTFQEDLLRRTWRAIERSDRLGRTTVGVVIDESCLQGE